MRKDESEMKVLVIEPDKQPQMQEIENQLTAMQMTVGGYIEVIYPWWDEVALVCNDAGKIMSLPLNRPLFNDDGELIDFIAGTFFICGASDSGEFGSLSDEQIARYSEMFRL